MFFLYFIAVRCNLFLIGFWVVIASIWRFPRRQCPRPDRLWFTDRNYGKNIKVKWDLSQEATVWDANKCHIQEQ